MPAHQGPGGRSECPPPRPQPCRVGLYTVPHPVAAAASSGRGTNTEITWRALGNSGEEQGRWLVGRGRQGKNSRTPCDHDGAASLVQVPIPHFLVGHIFPRYAPRAHRPRGPHRVVSVCVCVSVSPPHTPRTSGQDARTRAREHTRTRRPPWDVNKPRTPGCGRPSRECSHRVTYVHTLPPRPSGVDADASQPPSPFRPAPPGAQHPSTPPSSLRPRLGPGTLPLLPSTDRRWGHRAATAPALAPRPRRILGVREPCCLGAPRPRSRPGPAFLTPPRARFAWRPWHARVSLPSGLLSQPAPRSVSPPVLTAGCSEPGSWLPRATRRVLLWGGRRRRPREVVRRASRNYSLTGFLSFIKTQSCGDVTSLAAPLGPLSGLRASRPRPFPAPPAPPTRRARPGLRSSS